MPFDASPVESEVVTVLKKARALIDRPEKWCKGGYGESDQHCAFAAISRAGGRLNRVVAASLQLEQAIGHKHIERCPTSNPRRGDGSLRQSHHPRRRHAMNITQQVPMMLRRAKSPSRRVSLVWSILAGCGMAGIALMWVIVP
jgi:hypothetical protein